MNKLKLIAAELALERLGLRPLFGVVYGHGNDIHLLHCGVERNEMRVTAYVLPDEVLDIMIDSYKFDLSLYTTLTDIDLCVEACLLASLS